MIEVRGLTKDYQVVKRDPGLTGAVKALFKRKYVTKQAVKQIDFVIPKGEIVGYIGANGAGKSTTIKMLTGILTPTAWEVRVNGIIPYKERQKNALNIGAVFGQRTQLFWDIPVQESYELLKHIYQVPEAQFQETLRLFTEVLDLEPLLGIPVRQLSLGQKMRCELAAAFLHNPAVVYLDEPTIGLDVAVKRKIREFIKEINRRNQTTVILTTHDMGDIEELCKRIIIIDEGKVLYDGELTSIQDRFGNKRSIHFDLDLLDTFELPEELCPFVETIAQGEGENSSNVTLTFSSHVISGVDVISCIMKHFAVRDLAISDTKIETIVQEIYERGV